MSMRYYDFQVVLQEVPDEVSISLSITGCSLMCDGCHSPFLWNQNRGTLLTNEGLSDILKPYVGLASCVLFYGGEWHETELIEKLEISKSLGFKTCLYTGEDDVPDSIKEQLDYLKTGSWVAELGGLDSINTNQRFINVRTNEIMNARFMRKENKNEANTKGTN